MKKLFVALMAVLVLVSCGEKNEVKTPADVVMLSAGVMDVAAAKIENATTADEIIEGTKKRVQDYQGLVIKMKGTGVSRSVTVRKISNGVGVERVFPINSPVVAYVKVVSHGKVRRAKLYYLRDRKGKAAKIKQKI